MTADGLTDPQFVAALFAGFAGLLVAIATLLVALRTKGGVAEVHKLTNSRLTEMINRQAATDLRVEQLLGTLNRLNVDIPVAPEVLTADHPVTVVPPAPAPLSGQGEGPLTPDEETP